MNFKSNFKKSSNEKNPTPKSEIVINQIKNITTNKQKNIYIFHRNEKI